MLTAATERLAAARTALRRAEQRTGLANRVSRDIRHSEPHASAVNWRGEAHSDPWLGLNADSVGAVAVIGSPRIPPAAALSAHLDRDVHFEAISPEEFGELITPLFGAAAMPVVELYRALNAQTGNIIDRSTSAQRLLEISPRPVGQWLLAELSV